MKRNTSPKWCVKTPCVNPARCEWIGSCYRAIHQRRAMKDSKITSEPPKACSLEQLVRRLDAAHAELVEARKIAALSRHESYEEIGDAIECVEAASVWLHKSQNYPDVARARKEPNE